MNLLIHEAMLEKDILGIFNVIGLKIRRTKEKIKIINLKRDIAANVQISRAESGTCGYLMVICPQKMAAKIGETFFQMLPDDLNEETMRECVSEVLNMIGGNLQNNLDDANLDLPQVIENEVQLAEIQQIQEKSDLIYEFYIGHDEDPLFQVSVYSA